jgi:chromosomal replication initiation ATPase DnaA
VSLVAKMLTDKIGSADPELAEFLGNRPAESVRVLAGAVQRVLRAAESDGVQPTAAFARAVLDEAASGSAARADSASGVRTNKIATSPLAAIRSREKVVWRWPDVGERLIEEL